MSGLVLLAALAVLCVELIASRPPVMLASTHGNFHKESGRTAREESDFARFPGSIRHAFLNSSLILIAIEPLVSPTALNARLANTTVLYSCSVALCPRRLAMPDPSDRQDEGLNIEGAISRPKQAGHPQLKEFASFTYSPQIDGEVTTFAVQNEVAAAAPELPDRAKVEKFYNDSLPHLNLPSKVSVQTETLSLDEMLALITPKKSEHAARILEVALNYWRSIDSRAFGGSPYQNTPFKELEAQAQAASELLKQSKSILGLVKANFTGDPQKILKTFTESVAHYRGEPAWRSVQEASLMAAYEMVHDTGVTPHIPRPEMSSQGSQAEEPKQRKVINYGRPEAASGSPDTPRGGDRSDAEIRREQLKAASLEAESFQHKERLKEFDNLRNEIRKPQRPHERYGKLVPRPSAVVPARNLEAIPDWIKFSIEVGSSDQTISSRNTPPIQDVALEIADWATKFLNYTQMHVDSGAPTTWDFPWLQSQLTPAIKYHTHCKHIVQVVEDLSLQIRELGGYDSLSEKSKKIVDILAPERKNIASSDTAASDKSKSTSPSIQNSWGGDPISSEQAEQANATRMKAEQIRLLAITYLRDKPGKLRYIEDSETAWKVANEMATEAVNKPKRVLGE